MQPHSQPAADPGAPTPISAVRTGMDVVDAAGDRVGVVSAVQPPGTEVRPDLPAGVGEPFMATGYLRIDGTGELAHDAYVGSEQVATVSEADGVVTLAVPWAELTRAA